MSSNRDISISELCSHEAVNPWSEFGPTKRTIVDGELINSTINQPYPLSVFAGYHHDATPPGWPTGELETAETAKSIESGTKATFTPTICIGELSYPESAGVCLSLWDGSTIIGCEIQALSGLKETVVFNCETEDVIDSETEVTGKFHMVNTLDKDSFLAEPSIYMIHKVPEVEDFHCTVKMKIATAIAYSYVHPGAGEDFDPSDLGFSIGDGGTVGWSDAHFESAYVNGVTITAQLYERDYINDEWVHRGVDDELFTIGNYPALYSIGAVLSDELWSGHVVTTNDFLYQIVIDANS